MHKGEIFGAQRTGTLLTMQRALVEGSKSCGCSLACGLLESPTDSPIQRPFEAVAALIPGQTEQTLPLEFLSELLEQNRPAILKGKDTVWYSTVASALPLLAIMDVELIVEQIGLQGLQWSRNDLPSVADLEKGSQGNNPAGPEEMLRTLWKGMVDLPHGVEMLANDGVSRVRELRVHVEHHINRATSLEPETSSCEDSQFSPSLRR